MKEELPGIFNWAIEGVRKLRANGHFKIPAVSQEAWEEFNRDSNPAREFIEQAYELGSSNDAVPCSGAFDAYRAWCLGHGFKPLDATSFGKELRKVFGDLKRVRQGSGERIWSYHGLRALGSRTTAPGQVTVEPVSA